MTATQIGIFLAEMDAQFTGYYPVDYWNTGTILETTLPVSALLNDQWFNEATNLLYTCTIAGTPGTWNAGVEIPVALPAHPAAGDQWFDEDLNTLFTYIDGGWMDLNEVAEIMLDSDDNIYPDESIQINFNMAHSLMLIRRGSFINSVFVSEGLRNVIQFKAILGFQLVSRTSIKSPYKYGSRV